MQGNWALVIPAGGFVKDPLATALGTPRKALAKIGGTPCIVRTIEAAQQAGLRKIAVVSGEDVLEVVGHEYFVLEQGGQIENALAGVNAVEPYSKILFLPADTPFLSGSAISNFLAQLDEQITDAPEKWFAAGLCPYHEFLRILPGFEHPHLKLKDGDFMSGAFFAASRKGFYECAEMFKGFSKSRKSQLKMLMRIGLTPMVKYLMHQVSLKEGEEILSRFFDGKAIVIPNCDPWAMADIDTVDEYHRLSLEKGQEI